MPISVEPLSNGLAKSILCAEIIAELPMWFGRPQANAYYVRGIIERDAFVAVDERGVVVILAQSKSSQAKAVTIVVPVEHMPTASAALETWAERAGLRPGDMDGPCPRTVGA